MNPRLLVNENFPAPSIRLLRSRGWDVVAVAETLCGSGDPDVMEMARREGRWLVTFDRDYGELIFRRQLPMPPLLLLLRVVSYRPEEPAGWVRTLSDAGELREGFFHVFDGTAVRRRRGVPDIGNGGA